MKKNLFSKFLLKSVLLFSFLISNSSQVFSQNELFELSSIENAGITPQQISTLNSFVESKLYFDYQILKVKSLPTVQQNGLLFFKIPNNTKVFKAVADQVEYQNNKNYSWYGKIGDDQTQTGDIFILQEDSNISGFLKTEKDYYTLFPLGKEYVALMRNDINKAEKTVCGLDKAPKENPSNESINLCAESNNTCPAIIDVLVLVTSEAKKYLTGQHSNQAYFDTLVTYSLPTSVQVNFALKSAFESVNIAFKNSDITNKRIRTRFVDFSFNFTTTSNGNFSSKIPDLSADIANLKIDAKALALKNQFRADIVCLLSNQGYLDGQNNQIFGTIPFAGVGNPSSSNSFAIIETPFLLGPRYTLAHEIGHIFGALHSRSGSTGCNIAGDDDHSCGHGFCFFDSGKGERKTLLAMMPQGGSNRILHYSNPTVNFNGTATGDSQNDNAKVIKNTGCAVAAFQASPEWSVSILGESDVCVKNSKVSQCINITQAAPGFLGVAPFKIEWASSSSGIINWNNISILSTATCFDFPIQNTAFFIHARIKSADNQIITITKKIDVSNLKDCPSAQGKQSSNVINAATNT